MISHTNMIDTETKRLLRRVPTIRPFDLSILFDHIADLALLPSATWIRRCLRHFQTQYFQVPRYFGCSQNRNTNAPTQVRESEVL